MRRIFKAYSELQGIIYSERPFFHHHYKHYGGDLFGALNPIFVWVTRQVLNLGMDIAAEVCCDTGQVHHREEEKVPVTAWIQFLEGISPFSFYTRLPTVA